MPEIIVNKYKREEKDMSREAIIRFQIAVHCHFHKIMLNKHKMDALVLIGLCGKVGLTDLANKLKDLRIFTSDMGARNIIHGLIRKDLLTSEGSYRKMVSLHPDMRIQTTGNILLDIKCLHKDVAKESI